MITCRTLADHWLPKGTTCVPGIAGCHRQPKNPIGILHSYDQGINGNFCLSCTTNIQTISRFVQINTLMEVKVLFCWLEVISLSYKSLSIDGCVNCQGLVVKSIKMPKCPINHVVVIQLMVFRREVGTWLLITCMKSKSCHLIKTMLAMDAKSSTLQGIGTVVGQPKNSSYETEIDLFY